MAHEIAVVNGKSSIAYVGEKPWHGLGQELQENQPIEVWQEEAGMNWDIIETPVRFHDGQAMTKFGGNKVLFRSDTKEPLSIVSDDYKVVQPSEVLEFFRELVELQGMKLNTAGVLFGGKRFWALADTGRAADVLGNDRIKGMLLLTTSCDGTLATNAMFTSVRVVCNNTLQFAMREDVKDRARVTHRAVFDPSKVKQELGLFDSQWEDFKTSINLLAKAKVTDMKAHEFIRSLMVNPNRELDKQPYTVDKDTNTIMSRYIDGMGTDKAHGTLWGVLNAVTEHVDHDSRARNADNLLWGSWFGKGSKLKNKAFESALELI